MRHLASLALLSAVALTLVGCTPGLPAEEIVSNDTNHWNEFHAEYPDVPKPETTVIRTVELDEWAAVVADCLHEAGFPDVQAEADGGLSWETSQADAFALAKYICSEQYPLDPKYSVQVTDEQLGELYDYLTIVQVPCLEALGFDIPDAPSRTRFVETYPDEAEWLPYGQVVLPSVPGELYERAVESCPQTPPSGSEYDLYS